MKSGKYINCCLFCKYWSGHDESGKYNVKQCVKRAKETHRKFSCDGFRPDLVILESLRKDYKGDKHIAELLFNYETKNN